jgi:putative ABC transport system permease protein
MIPISYRKVWRDLWINKGRTIMVVVSIATGIAAIGMILSGNIRTVTLMSQSHAASQPAHIFMWLGHMVDDEVVHSLSRVEGVLDIDASRDAVLRWKPSLESEWREVVLRTIDDYEAQTFNLIELKQGSWPSAKTVAVEHNHLRPFGIPPMGEYVFLEVNERPRPYLISGVVRDPLISVPPFETRASMYVTMATMEQITGWQGYDQLRISVPDFTEEEAELVAERIKDKLNKQGIIVGFTLVQPPDKHWASQQIEGVGLIMGVMAVASLFLSVVLVFNTINALMTRQISQIGIMKAIGGQRKQITLIYLSAILTYGLLSVLIAVPLGALAGQILSSWILGLINVPPGSFSLNMETFAVQIAAGILVPLLAGAWPVLKGTGISVHQAISQYGLGGGFYGTGRVDRLIGRIKGLPRMVTLSLRNTFRRTGRVALTQIVLLTSGAIFIMVVSAQYSFSRTIEDAWQSLGFDAFLVFEQTQRVDEIVPIVQAHEDVNDVEMWLWWGGTVKVPGSGGIGDEERIDLRAVPFDSKLYTPKLTAGRGFIEGDEHAILLNQYLARELDLVVGDQVEIEIVDHGTSTWTIVGLIFDLTNMQETGYVPIDTFARDMNAVGRASVVELSANGNDPSANLALIEELKGTLESRGFKVGYTRTAYEDRAEAEAQFKIVINLLMIMTVLMAIVGSIGLSGTLSINVLERQREIGVMRAVGASSLDVALIFIYEGLLLGLLSWVIAVPVGFLIGHPFMLALGEVLNFPAQYSFTFQGVWIWLIIVTILSLAASWLPARRATRVSVNQSLAYE